MSNPAAPESGIGDECPWMQDALHKLHAIGYEKMAEQETYSIHYFVIWACDACTQTWWVEDLPPAKA